MWSTAQRQHFFTDLMFMLGVNETMDQFAMANSVRWYGQLLKIEDGNVLRRLLDFELKGPRKKGRLKMTWKRQTGEESVKGRCTLSIKVECRHNQDC